MNYKHYRHIHNLLLRFLYLLLIYSVFRIAFYMLNASLFPTIPISDCFMILIQGVRFDIAAILYLNLIPFLLLALPLPFGNKKWFRALVNFLFILFNIFGFILVLTDFAFYPFSAKRLDSEVLSLVSALPTMISSFFFQYWYFFLLLLALIIGLVKLTKYIDRKADAGNFHFMRSLVAFLLVGGFMFLGLRGGIQSRPIRPVMAASFVSLDLAPLVTNSAFTFIHSAFNRKLSPKNYYAPDEVEKIFSIKHELLSDTLAKEKANIVHIILESFTGAYIGHLGVDTSYTPYLDSLSKHALAFTRSFSNGRRSSQGLVALTAGLPALMDDPFMYSPYLNNRIYGLPQLLKKEGYSTSFFSGSSREMLGWQDYISAVGFDSYFSREDYPNQEHYDGYWGIYDHYFLDYFLSKCDEFKEPFFSAFFSLSSHDPYLIPPQLMSKFQDYDRKYFNALAYTDWAVARFFEKARKKDWFDNTIFIITADHTINAADKSPDKDYYLHSWKTNRIGLYHIPTLIYAPSKGFEGVNHKVIQQLDVFNTTLELAGYTGPYYSFGKSAFLNEEGCAFQYVKGVYQMIQGDYLFLMKEDKPFALYNYMEDRDLQKNILDKNYELAGKLLLRLKAIIQMHNHVLIENNMRLE